MNIFIKSSVCAIWLTVTSLFAPTFAAAPPLKQTILVVGDSLSAAYGLSKELGWVSLLSLHLKSQGYNYNVINASISGETTAGGWQRLPQLLQQHQPSVVIIELGGNDALRGLDITNSRNTLSKMIVATKSTGAKTLLLPMKIPPNYGQKYAKEFELMYNTLAKQHQIALSAFFLQAFAFDASYFQRDRIHPTAKAQPLMLEAVWPSLKPLLKK